MTWCLASSAAQGGKGVRAGDVDGVAIIEFRRDVCMIEDHADVVGAINVLMAGMSGSPVKWAAQQGRQQRNLPKRIRIGRVPRLIAGGISRLQAGWDVEITNRH
jgi:hypothetical protein